MLRTYGCPHQIADLNTNVGIDSQGDLSQSSEHYEWKDTVPLMDYYLWFDSGTAFYCQMLYRMMIFWLTTDSEALGFYKLGMYGLDTRY